MVWAILLWRHVLKYNNNNYDICVKTIWLNLPKIFPYWHGSWAKNKSRTSNEPTVTFLTYSDAIDLSNFTLHDSKFHINDKSNIRQHMTPVVNFGGQNPNRMQLWVIMLLSMVSFIFYDFGAIGKVETDYIYHMSILL